MGAGDEILERHPCDFGDVKVHCLDGERISTERTVDTNALFIIGHQSLLPMPITSSLEKPRCS